MDFELLGPLRQIETMFGGRRLRQAARLRRRYGEGRWQKRKGIARVRLMNGVTHTAEVHWYEAHGVGRREFKITFPLLDWVMKKSTKTRARFVVCIRNKGYEASLDIEKIYRVVSDPDAEKRSYLRIVDESGEDYGYSSDRFFALDLPNPLEKALARAAS